MKALKIILLVGSLCSVLTSSSQLECKKGGFSLGYAHHLPEDDSLISTGAFTMDVFFLKRYHRFFNTSFGVEMNAGARRFNKVIENITFEGDYEGFVDYSVSRTEFWGKFMIGTQIKNIVEFTVPVKIGYRHQAYREFFDIYDGQEIKEEDLIEEGSEEDNPDTRFAKTNNIGFGTGLNLAFFPSSGVSPFIEAGYTYFGKQDHQSINNASQNDNGTINIPSYQAQNSSNYTFRVGVRFNIGSCPKKTGNIFEDSRPSTRTEPNRSHKKVETRIVDRSVNTQQNNNSNNNTNTSSETKPNVKLKPKVKPRKVPPTKKPGTIKKKP